MKEQVKGRVSLHGNAALVFHPAGMQAAEMGKPAVVARTKQVGELIRSRREAKRLSQERLAAMVGRDPSTVWRWETGAARPDYESAKRLQLCLRGKVSDYLG